MNELINELKNECRDLFYVSETESAVTPFVFENKEALLKALDEFAASDFPGKREKKDFHEFFSKVTAEKDWHGDFEKKSVRAFRNIEKIFAARTTRNELLRQGDKKIKIFAFGESEDGKIYGIEMMSVET